MSITPVLTVEHNTVTTLDKGLKVELVYKGETRTGFVENGTHPTLLTLQVANGYRSFKRDKIEQLAFLVG